jgi:hypothetical protein
MSRHACGRRRDDLSLGESKRSGEYNSDIWRLLELPEVALPAGVAAFICPARAYAGTAGATRFAGQNTGRPRDIA